MRLLGGLYLNDTHSDVTFIVDDVDIPAHKIILLTRSVYFEGLFRGNFVVGTQARINLSISLEPFKLILRYIYTGCISLSDLNLDHVIDVMLFSKSIWIWIIKRSHCIVFNRQNINWKLLYHFEYGTIVHFGWVGKCMHEIHRSQCNWIS